MFLCWDETIEKPSLLIELKVATTGFMYDEAKPLQEMRKKVNDLRKEEIVNIELDSWKNMLMLKSVGINVVIILYVSFHPQEKWLAVIPEESLNLRSFSKEEMKQTKGSGTPIANILARIDDERVFSLWKWINNQFQLPIDEVKEFFLSKEQLLS